MTAQHLQISLLGVLWAFVVGIPLGLLLSRFKFLVGPVLWAANAIQTVPALALVGFIMLFLGLTPATGITVLFLYSLMPIIRATYVGVTQVDPGMIEAARGMGMTTLQILRMVQLPLAFSVILAGLRVATVAAIGTASIMSLAGAGGLGQEIFKGIDRVNNTMILAGAVPAAVLAVLAEVGISALERRLTPRGLRIQTAS